MKKLNQNKIKGESRKILTDTMLVTVAGIAAAMKNTG
jgi:phosphoenolpyruvate carboxylase